MFAVAAPSFAAESASAATAERATSISLRAAPGLFYTSTQYGGVQIGVEALVTHGWVVAGGAAKLSSEVFGFDDVAVGPELGVSIPVPQWARVEVLGVGGARHYSGVGRGFLTANPGVDGTLPFIGLQTHLGLELGKPAARFTLGLRPFIETDIGRLTKTHSFQESELLSTNTHEETRSEQIGLTRAGVSLAIGGAFGL